MLADEHAGTLVTSFAAQWLHLRRMRTVAPDVNAFPAFDENLRAALIRETELFVESQLREDRGGARARDAARLPRSRHRPARVRGACDAGFSCAYISTLCWRTRTTPLPMESNPRALFERLFGDGAADPAARRARRRQERSILDAVTRKAARLRRGLGAADRAKLADYLAAVRDVERRIQRAEAQSDRELPAVERPAASAPAAFADYVKVMFDLQVLAHQTDMTRVASFLMTPELTAQTYPEIGVPDPHHALSHHENQPESLAKLTRIGRYHAGLFAHYLDRLRETPDGDGSLLDQVMILYGSGMSNSNLHNIQNLPILLAGGGAGRLRGNRHLRFADGTPLTNLYLTLLGKLGVPAERVGDSTGRLASLGAV